MAREITVNEAAQALCKGTTLIDIRELDEHVLGVPRGAQLIRKSELEAAPEKYLHAKDQPVYLICAAGARSSVAADFLTTLGYQTFSVIGGFNAWREANLPIEESVDSDQKDFYQRYARHLRLPQVGITGQKILNQSTVTVIGAGGLGSPVLFYLAAAGIGHLHVVDGDVIDRSNLQRQILHRDQDVGISKAASAKRALQELNPSIEIHAHPEYFKAENAQQLVQAADVVVDATDNFPARYTISDICQRLQIPWVYAAIHRFEGQLSVFDNRSQSTNCACYRCLFPQQPDADNAPNCAEAGVLGVLPGILGSLQATEVIKLILGIGEPMTGRLLHFDALSLRFYESRYQKDPKCVC